MQSSASYHGGSGPCHSGAYGADIPDGAVERVIDIHTAELRPWTSGVATTEADVTINSVEYHVQQFTNNDCGCHAVMHFKNWDVTGSPAVILTFNSPGGGAQFVIGAGLKFYDSDDAIAGFSVFSDKQNQTAVGVANDAQIITFAAPGQYGNTGADRWAVLKLERFASDPWDTYAGTLDLYHCAVVYPLT